VAAVVRSRFPAEKSEKPEKGKGQEEDEGEFKKKKQGDPERPDRLNKKQRGKRMAPKKKRDGSSGDCLKKICQHLGRMVEKNLAGGTKIKTTAKKTHIHKSAPLNWTHAFHCQKTPKEPKGSSRKKRPLPVKKGPRPPGSGEPPPAKGPADLKRAPCLNSSKPSYDQEENQPAPRRPRKLLRAVGGQTPYNKAVLEMDFKRPRATGVLPSGETSTPARGRREKTILRRGAHSHHRPGPPSMGGRK